MRTYVLFAVVAFSLITPFLVAQTSGAASPPIPEEARRHFVMGATLFKDAKTPDDYAQVESQFKQAVDLAPQWPDARYNLALAKEAAGDFSGAMTDLKLYQQFKLSDSEARTVQDKIYAIDAKQEKKAAEKKALDEANRPAAQLEKLIQSLDGGVWRCVSSTDDDPVQHHRVDAHVGDRIEVSGHMINGYMGSWKDRPLWQVPLTSRNFDVPSYNRYYENIGRRYSDEFTISDDGRTITESLAFLYHDSGGTYDITGSRTYTRDR